MSEFFLNICSENKTDSNHTQNKKIKNKTKQNTYKKGTFYKFLSVWVSPLNIIIVKKKYWYAVSWINKSKHYATFNPDSSRSLQGSGCTSFAFHPKRKVQIIKIGSKLYFSHNFGHTELDRNWFTNIKMQGNVSFTDFNLLFSFKFPLNTTRAK